MRFAIIGAGLAGLTAAYEIHKADPSAVIDVLEAGERIGGKLFTVPFASGPTDIGAEAFLAARSDAVEFFTELGLADSLVSPSEAKSQYYAGGKLHEFPAGGVMGIPAEAPTEAPEAPADTDHPFDWTPGQDISVGELVRRQYGDEIVDTVVSSLLGGVYSSTADDLGVRASVPALAAALDQLAEAGEQVTLSAAVKTVQAQREATKGTSETSGTSETRPVFQTFKGGYAELYEALAEQCGADIHLDSFVSAITKNAEGFTIKGGGEGTYDKVILAVPAPTAAVLLRDVAPDAAPHLRAIKLASSAIVGMRFDSSDGLPDNSGVLVAVNEPGITAKAFTFSSKKWPHLESRGGALVRASFGRLGDEASARMDEDLLVDAALDDLLTITGFDGRAAGLSEIFVQRWFGGLPAYGVDHIATVAAARAEIAHVPGIEAIGAWAGGVGVPAVIADAQAAVHRLIK
ncbi:protoporphyrinogen oxidase [Corynebacterium suranareeae]|uniref:Coproporphyrinogen III oxidase n=1 Tax=Corynebacterium suranareeae TaxID=2506452 RepID=A0A160PM29_9CORY|nr:protoporphyrinogen oxidase [Corynebacterium suranareeae]BAU94837.1 protoporphyrinogen oxidase [Corynebacterium suranareeae]